jgi:branched-chain amino acid transport system permease protein
MTEFITFTILGLALGAVYAIAAAGLVVTYTTSGIFNFAHGAISMFCAFLYWQLRWSEGWGGQWPAPLALFFVICIVGPLIGVVVEAGLMRSLRGTSETTQIVIPVALMLAFIGLANWIWQAQEPRIPAPFFGNNSKVAIGDVNIRTHQLVIFACAIALAIALRFLLYRTRTGVTMRSVVDNRELAQLNGARPDRASMLSWALGSGLAALAGVLLSPLLGGLQVLALTLLVVNAFAAAIIGRLRSLPLTFLGALIVGLGRNYWEWISESGQRWGWLSGLRFAVPVVILFVALLLLPQDRLRGASVERAKERFALPSMPQTVGWALGFVVIIAAMAPLLTTKWETVLSTGLAYAIIASSLVLLTGYAGEINLAPLAFAGIGAIAMFQFDVGSGAESTAGFIVIAVALSIAVGLLILPALGLSGGALALAMTAFSGTVFVLVTFFDATSGTGIAARESASPAGFVVAALFAAAVGAVVALPALRLRGLYLGLATFAFAIFVENMVFKQRGPLQFNIPFYGDGEDIEINLFSGGTLNLPRPAWFGVDFGDGQTAMMILLSVIFSIIGICLIVLRRSSYGRQLSAMKDSPAACATLGLDLTRLKLSVFTLSAGIAGFGGALMASHLRTVQEDSPFSSFNSLGLFMLTVVGGIGAVSGALIGGVFLGALFLVMSEFWDKMAADFESFSWFFTFLGDFFTFLGVGLAGIGLGRNPSGIASQMAEGYAVLRAPRNRPVLIGGLVLVVGVWTLRIVDVIDGWTFVLILLPFLLALWPAIGAARLARDHDAEGDAPGAEAATPGTDGEAPDPSWWGIDTPLGPAQRELLDEELGVRTPPTREDRHAVARR